MLKQLLKDWRVILVIVFVVLAIVAIRPSFGGGVVVTSISQNSPLADMLSVGEVIDWMNDKKMNSPEDFNAFENYTGVLKFVHNGKLDLKEIITPGLGINVAQKPATNLNLGLDLIGGTRVLLEPKENVTDAVMQQLISTLETRINLYGLREAKFQAVKDVSGNNYALIEMAGGSKEEIENLLAKQGMFEGKIERIITFSDNRGVLVLDNKSYDVVRNGDYIDINGNVLGINQSTTLNGIEIQFFNSTENNVTLLAKTFTGEDIVSVCIQDSQLCVSRIAPVEGGWQFMFQVEISQAGAEKFARITRNMKSIVLESGESYLDGKIVLFLDGSLINSLNIHADLAGKDLKNPSIEGFRTSRDDALKEKLTLQSILQSGSLPVGVNIVRIDQISPTLGRSFITATLIAAVIASISVMGVIFFRYRKFKILLIMMIWSISETILILGAASLIKWTIDLASIAGIIAAIGTGTNDQIMIVDEIIMGGGEGEKKIYTVKQRVKRAFFIVFGAAGTIVAAMLPLMFVGIGVMRGFAITTTIGVMIGVFITRPAFGRVAEKILEKEEFSQPKEVK
jgi:protein-export membrane protein SecD